MLSIAQSLFAQQRQEQEVLAFLEVNKSNNIENNSKNNNQMEEEKQ